MAEVTSKYDPDISFLEIFVDGVLAAEWYCDLDAEGMVEEFKRVFGLGCEYQIKQAGELIGNELMLSMEGVTQEMIDDVRSRRARGEYG